MIAGVWGYTGDSKGTFTSTFIPPSGWTALANKTLTTIPAGQQNVGWFYHLITDAAASRPAMCGPRHKPDVWKGDSSL